MKHIIVSFDLWNTIVVNVSYKQERIKIIQKYLLSQGFEHSQDEIEIAYKEIHKKIKQNKEKEENKYTSLQERILVLCNHLKVTLMYEEIEELIGLLQEPVIQAPPPLKEGIYELIQEVEKSAHLICTSDTGMTCGNTVKKVLKIHGLDRFFETYVFSEDIGYNKPDTQMFQSLINNTYRISNKYIFHVGDLYLTDIVGARRARINSININFNNEYMEENDEELTHYKINCVSDIVQILKGKS